MVKNVLKGDIFQLFREVFELRIGECAWHKVRIYVNSIYIKLAIDKDVEHFSAGDLQFFYNDISTITDKSIRLVKWNETDETITLLFSYDYNIVY